MKESVPGHRDSRVLYSKAMRPWSTAAETAFCQPRIVILVTITLTDVSKTTAR